MDESGSNLGLNVGREPPDGAPATRDGDSATKKHVFSTAARKTGQPTGLEIEFLPETEGFRKTGQSVAEHGEMPFRKVQVKRNILACFEL